MLKFEWHDAHADQITAMDALIAFRDHRADPEKTCAFGRPVTRRAGAILFAGDHEQRNTRFAIFYRGVIDRHSFAARKIESPAAFRTGRWLIAEADIGESSAN